MQCLPQWRTVIVVLGLGGMLLVGLDICAGLEEATIGMAVGMFTAFAAALVGLAGVQGGASSVQHLAGPGGGGVKGAVAALMTDAAPKPLDNSNQPPPAA